MFSSQIFESGLYIYIYKKQVPSQVKLEGRDLMVENIRSKQIEGHEGY